MLTPAFTPTLAFLGGYRHDRYLLQCSLSCYRQWSQGGCAYVSNSFILLIFLAKVAHAMCLRETDTSPISALFLLFPLTVKKIEPVAVATETHAAPVAGDKLAGIVDPDLKKLLEEVPEFVEYIGSD